MKQILATAVAMLAISTTANAADNVVFEQSAAAYNWSGVYVGAQVGHGWGRSEYMATNGAFANPDPDGFFGGGYVGYNTQFNSGLVLGVEADFAFSQIDGTGVFPLSPEFTTDADVNWSAAVRARLGYAYDRFLPYIAAGLTIADYDHNLVDTGIQIDSFNDTYSGWTIGAGVEYAVTDNLILRGEYRYSDFGSARFPGTPAAVEHDVDLKTNDLRLGIAYKF
ncbi:Adhesin/invasin protein PagN [Aminobacter sp. MSH1]|uniref:outer membrane protein n=1 Tax=Aminobacter sp. MSH1 TaxID=374606 RepID=UPI000D3D1B8D|nr:outer membrane protein [Aminobacter sp. MSH1]AWC24212.1 Adhesin/invasin protein PagN [Aminobacter sp. MSH1]